MYNKNMNFLTKTDNGIILSLKLVPNSSFSKVVDYTDEYVRVKISSPPIENKANKELISFCSKLLDVNKSKIEIVSGEKSKLKKVLIKDTKLEEVTKTLMFVLDSLHKEK